MFEKSIFNVVATPASLILIRSSNKKKQTKKQPLCPVTVLVDSQVSDHCPWATCWFSHEKANAFYAILHIKVSVHCTGIVHFENKTIESDVHL